MNKITVHHAKMYPLKIRLRERMGFADVQYEESRPVVVAVELQSGAIGYGEAMPDCQMNQLAVDEIIQHLETIYIPLLLNFHPESFGEALEAIENFPLSDRQNRSMNIARSAIESALLEVTLKSYHRAMDDVVRWMGLPGFGLPGSMKKVRCVGVLSFVNLPFTLRHLRKLYWRGVRDFKLLIRENDEIDQWTKVFDYLRKPLSQGRATLSLDFQGKWWPERVGAWLQKLDHYSVTGLEQPIPVGEEESLLELSKRFRGATIFDESVVTLDDAKRLTGSGGANAFNLRIGKCGGLLPTLRIASHVRKSGIRIILGTTPGQTSLSTRSNLDLLSVCPGIMFIEGWFENRLLSEDVTQKPYRFRNGGRVPKMKNKPVELKISVDQLTALSADGPFAYPL